MRLIPSDPDVRTILGRIEDGTLDLQPDFQRGAVWSGPKQQLLIDSILRNWYVPPVHVVAVEDDMQEVLDGQQRLRAVANFFDNLIKVDGTAEPLDEEIQALDGLRFRELPSPYQRRFERFTIRVFEVVDYSPSEPFELFYRLNQPTTLTSAEKRNAFFGVVRDQVKDLTQASMEAGMTPDRVGFSNKRLAYEDVIARFVWTLEQGTLSEKSTARRITDWYRRDERLSPAVEALAEESARILFSAAGLDAPSIRLNKATAHSWLLFLARALETNALRKDEFGGFFVDIEEQRHRLRAAESHGDYERSPYRHRLLEVFQDRATARANDVSSVLLRDLCLWLLALDHGAARDAAFTRLEVARGAIEGHESLLSESALLDALEAAEWGPLL